MINTNILADLMSNYPDFSYEVNPIDNSESVELIIERYRKSPGIGYRKVKKVFDKNEDIGVLEEILKGSD